MWYRRNRIIFLMFKDTNSIQYLNKALIIHSGVWPVNNTLKYYVVGN